MVTRIRSQKDRRAVDVELTKEGFKVLFKVAPGVSKLMKEVIGSFTEQERDVLVKLAHRISYAATDYLGADKEHLDTNARLLAGMVNNGSQPRKRV